MACRSRLGALALLALVAACGDGPTAVSGPLDLSAEWLTAAPATVGLRQDQLDAAVAHARTLPNVTSLLVVRHGRLGLEAYFHGGGVDRLADVRSVTKSVISTLVGAAVDRGLLSGIHEPIGPHLGPEFGDELSPEEEAITFHDLLTMAGGWEWDESTAGYNTWVSSGDPVRYLLRRPLAHPPGTHLTYNSAGVHLLGLALERATGRTVPQLASEYVFGPLGVRAVEWERFPDGTVNGGSGIDLRPRDLAKLGALWLQDGDAGAVRVLPEGWVEMATTSRYPLWPATAPLGQQGYGFLWWIDRADGRTHFFAWGYGGQFVWVAPDLNLVAVVTTAWRSATVPSGQLEANGLRLIIDYVLPAAAPKERP